MTEKKIPIEKRILMSKRNLLKEAIPYMDPILEFRSKVKAISDDGDLNFAYCWDWVLEEMGLTGTTADLSEDDDDDDDDEESTDQVDKK